ncbi:hypothetical protein [Streptomyces sp. NPDC050600]|uniref:hypothetical protein n=1 Tax=Streptomyces sp. NPDC050600 TaxID=3157213 RepID=UPI00341B466E
MARNPDEFDQIVFRWDSENVTGTTGFGPVAWSGARTDAEGVFHGAGSLLRASGDETRPALIRLQRRGGDAVLIRRLPWTDPGGGASALCHALVGSPEALGAATCLGLHAWHADLELAEVRGELPTVWEETLLSAVGEGQFALDARIPDVAEELVGVAAELLRHPDDRFTFLDERGDTALPVLWGLHSMFGLVHRSWTFASHDTAELPGLRFVFVSRWSGAATRNTDRRRTDPRERLGDPAESVATRLVEHHLRGLEEGDNREFAVSRALEHFHPHPGTPLLTAAQTAAARLDRRYPARPGRAAPGRAPGGVRGENAGRGEGPGWASESPRGGESPWGTDSARGAASPRGADSPWEAERARGDEPRRGDESPRAVESRATESTRGAQSPWGDEGRRGAESPRGADSPRGGEQPWGAESPRAEESPQAAESPWGNERARGAEPRRGAESPWSTDSPRTADSPRAAGSPPAAEPPRGADSLYGDDSPPGTDAPRGAESSWGAGSSRGPETSRTLEASRPKGERERGSEVPPPSYVPRGSEASPPSPTRRADPAASPWAGPAKPGRRARWRRGPAPKEGGLGGRLDRAENVGQAQAAAREASDADLLGVLRDRGLPHRLTTVLVQEAAHRLPAWNRRLRHELRDLVLGEAYFVYRVHPADHVEPAERGADAAALHRWAVAPVLGGRKSGSGGRNADAAVAELADLLARFRTSPHAAARTAFDEIVRDERSGLPESVLRGLVLGTQRHAERDHPPDPGRPPSAPPDSRPEGRPRPAPPAHRPDASAPGDPATAGPTSTGPATAGPASPSAAPTRGPASPSYAQAGPASTSHTPAGPAPAGHAAAGPASPGHASEGPASPSHVPAGPAPTGPAPARPAPPSRIPPTSTPPPPPPPTDPTPDPTAPANDGRVVVGVLGAVLVLLVIVIFASILTR